MELISVHLEFSKSTAGTHVYMEDAGKPRAEKVFPTIYVQKHVLPDPPPRVIRVTLEEVSQ
jgi:hypothetical protein